jgi:hypothetical protein
MSYARPCDLKMVLFPPVMLLFLLLGAVALPVAALLFVVATRNVALLFVATARSFPPCTGSGRSTQFRSSGAPNLPSSPVHGEVAAPLSPRRRPRRSGMSNDRGRPHPANPRVRASPQTLLPGVGQP